MIFGDRIQPTVTELQEATHLPDPRLGSNSLQILLSPQPRPERTLALGTSCCLGYFRSAFPGLRVGVRSSLEIIEPPLLHKQQGQAGLDTT